MVPPHLKVDEASAIVLKAVAAKKTIVKRPAGHGMPHFHHEKSRSQFLCRVPGGHSFAVKYSNKKEEAAALAKVEQWKKTA